MTSEYLADDSSGTLVAISIAFAVLTTVFLALRLYSKQFTASGYSSDDIFLATAYIFILAMCAVGVGESLNPNHCPRKGLS
jgi:hypothetical protein